MAIIEFLSVTPQTLVSKPNGSEAQIPEHCFTRNWSEANTLFLSSWVYSIYFQVSLFQSQNARLINKQHPQPHLPILFSFRHSCLILRLDFRIHDTTTATALLSATTLCSWVSQLMHLLFFIPDHIYCRSKDPSEHSTLHNTIHTNNIHSALPLVTKTKITHRTKSV